MFVIVFVYNGSGAYRDVSDREYGGLLCVGDDPQWNGTLQRERAFWFAAAGALVVSRWIDGCSVRISRWQRQYLSVHAQGYG